ncbi:MULTISPECIES: SpoIIE family protein phosphatase [Streptomyces]|uniref:Stage II sporulation protein E n=1 Tax=Streptomyces albus (strain ATCC 21838 / DSM 41398 / FERM P-419 / JCM 4703 / NBRC 107858) TaxID=1081613 RepID=A0A0B5EP45_STRA4|nr:SpoIIE family protein phosphatase [Streptomyces sp. SCSIO ZS0520]AJE84533.1 stage II sporulation protein E [Streptomyces albus]AOU78843.1 stage II sporulation protein E [Streptomyces albus]AYN34579.1 aromatic ring-opening dioxygenase LigA [Streptomyces albus]
MSAVDPGTEEVPGTTTRQVRVDHHSAVHLAAETARAVAEEGALPGALPDRAAVIASELAANLDKHARDGSLYLQHLPAGEGIEILAVDSGPGIGDLALSLTDGFSTTGTLGAGLGAVSRIADEFTIRTEAGGTLMSARMRRPGAPAPHTAAGVLCLPLEGESACGDAWAVADSEEGVTALVVDGLGHGEQAAEAAQLARRHFLREPGRPLPELLTGMHRALRRTRGAAAGLVRLRAGTAESCGIGNIRLMLLDDRRVHARVTGQPGIVGFTLPVPRVQRLDAPAGASLVLCSDGIDHRWADSPSPFLLRLPPPLLAAALCRDRRRTRDDATALAVRVPGRQP